MSNKVGIPSSGTAQPNFSDELESTPVMIRGDHHMTNANINSTSEVSEITDGTSILSSLIIKLVLLMSLLRQIMHKFQMISTVLMIFSQPASVYQVNLVNQPPQQ